MKADMVKTEVRDRVEYILITECKGVSIYVARVPGLGAHQGYRARKTFEMPEVFRNGRVVIPARDKTFEVVVSGNVDERGNYLGMSKASAKLERAYSLEKKLEERRRVFENPGERHPTRRKRHRNQFISYR